MNIIRIIQFIQRQIKQIWKGGTSVLVYKVIIAMRLITIILIGGVSVLACYAIRPLITIRFGHLYTSRIGHLCYNMDNYLADRRRRESREFAVFKVDARISNIAIYKLWRDKKNVLFTNFADFPLQFLATFLPNSNLLISWRNELHPEFTVFSSTPSNIDIKAIDKLEYEKVLDHNGIIYPYICLHNRDSAYLDHYGSDGNIHDFRDFDFHDFELGINRITNSGIMAVRLGEKIKTEYKVDNQMFISMTGLKRSDFSDIVIISKCLFFVGCNTGFSNVSRIFRKPELLINYIPFRISELSALAAGSIILPKKIYKVNNNRYLRYAEMATLPYDIHYPGDFFGDNGLRVEDNSQEEIADAIMEMWMRVTGRWKDSEAQCQSQDKFWSSVAHIRYANEVRSQLGIGISSTFLKKNQFLI